VQVLLHRQRSVPPGTPTLPPRAEALLHHILDKAHSNKWRLQLVKLVTNTGAITCSQAARFVSCMHPDRAEQTTAAVALVPCTVDLENLHELEDALGGTATHSMQQQLGFSDLLCARNITGRYVLQLSKQVRSCCCSMVPALQCRSYTIQRA
jgi:hypothetical protein